MNRVYNATNEDYATAYFEVRDDTLFAVLLDDWVEMFLYSDAAVSRDVLASIKRDGHESVRAYICSELWPHMATFDGPRRIQAGLEVWTW